MRTSKYSEEQIIGFLRQAEAGMPIKEIGRKHGFSDASFYKWRSRRFKSPSDASIAAGAVVGNLALSDSDGLEAGIRHSDLASRYRSFSSDGTYLITKLSGPLTNVLRTGLSTSLLSSLAASALDESPKDARCMSARTVNSRIPLRAAMP